MTPRTALVAKKMFGHAHHMLAEQLIARVRPLQDHGTFAQMAAQHGIDCARCEEKRIDVIIRVGRDPAPAAV
jgi:ASC-1-like (ASCH) protein